MNWHFLRLKRPLWEEISFVREASLQPEKHKKLLMVTSIALDNCRNPDLIDTVLVKSIGKHSGQLPFDIANQFAVRLDLESHFDRGCCPVHGPDSRPRA